LSEHCTVFTDAECVQPNLYGFSSICMTYYNAVSFTMWIKLPQISKKFLRVRNNTQEIDLKNWRLVYSLKK